MKLRKPCLNLKPGCFSLGLISGSGRPSGPFWNWEDLSRDVATKLWQVNPLHCSMHAPARDNSVSLVVACMYVLWFVSFLAIFYGTYILECCFHTNCIRSLKNYVTVVLYAPVIILVLKVYMMCKLVCNANMRVWWQSWNHTLQCFKPLSDQEAFF